jgi:hypothetical protein
VIHQFNIRRFILIFVISLVIFTPLIIEARHNALNLVEQKDVREAFAVQLALAPENHPIEPAAMVKIANRESGLRGRHGSLAGYQGLRPKINHR